MKKISLSLLAFAALSSAAFAGSNRNYDLRESPTYFGQYSENTAGTSATTDSKALAVETPAGGMTNFERMNMNSIENDHGRH
jgi:hypothetical protein